MIPDLSDQAKQRVFERNHMIAEARARFEKLPVSVQQEVQRGFEQAEEEARFIVRQRGVDWSVFCG